jgi:hypothetical protein
MDFHWTGRFLAVGRGLGEKPEGENIFAGTGLGALDGKGLCSAHSFRPYLILQLDWSTQVLMKVLVSNMLCPKDAENKRFVSCVRNGDGPVAVGSRSRLFRSNFRSVDHVLCGHPLFFSLPHMSGTRQNVASTTANPSTSRSSRSAAVKRDSLTAELERGLYNTKLSHIVVLTSPSQIHSSRPQNDNSVRTFSPRAWRMPLSNVSSSKPAVRK